MLFKPELAYKVLRGEKTETRRIVKAHADGTGAIGDTLQRLKPRSFYSTLALTVVRRQQQGRYVKLYGCVPSGST